MQLERINQETCDICGAVTISDSRKPERHTNGQAFEERTFACGCIIQWVPNFSRLEVRQVCPNSPAQTELKKKRNDLLYQIRTVIFTSDADQEFKDRIEVYLPRY